MQRSNTLPYQMVAESGNEAAGLGRRFVFDNADRHSTN
jgi:hypothetical protein